MKVVGYTRVSTEEQATKGVSLADQRHRIEAWSVALDAEIVSIESDEGVSGSIDPMRRPGLARALGIIRAGGAEGLVVTTLDRASRNSSNMLLLAQEKGWRLISITESIDTATAHGQLVLTIMAGVAQYQVDTTKERTRDALRRIRSDGRSASRFTPWGWRLPDGGYELDRIDEATMSEAEIGERQERNRRKLTKEPSERVLLRLAWNLGVGCRRLASELNGLGLRNPRTQKQWKRGQTAGLLVAATQLAGGEGR